jgi:hypothetical protein
MSYSALIQKDKPDIFWSLDETSGTVVFADGYIIDPDISPTKTVLNQGVYGASIGSGITSNPLPIIYGGSSCIKINDSDPTSFIKVPSLYKMTTADAKNPSAIEFWIKISNTSTTRQNFMTTDSGASIGIVNDHIIFSIGSYSVSVHVDTVNKPIHIIAGYSSNDLTLIVNGILKTKKIFKYSDIFTDTWNNGGSGVNKNDFKFVKPSGINNFQIDSIALYSYIPSRITALRHYGYGVAYNPPTEFFDANNAVYYNFSMENQQVIKKYSMGQSGDSWKITDSNNALIENDCLTIKKRNLLNVNFPVDYGDILNLQSYFKASDEYAFETKSYLTLENTDSLIPAINGGWSFKFVKGSGNLTQEQTYFYVGSNNSNNYIEVKANTTGIIVYLNGIASLTFTISSIPDYFYLGYYIKSNETIDFIYLPSTGAASIQNTGVLNGLSFTNTFIRIGSANTWTVDNDSSIVDKATQALSTFNLSKIVAIHKDNSALYSTYANIEGASFKHYYTVVPNYLEKRFKTKSYASGRTSIALQSLLNEDTSYAGATRLEIGNPYGNDNLKVYVTGNRYTTNSGTTTTSNFKSKTQLTDRIIVNGDWLNKQDIILSPSESVSDVLDFDFELYTDDLFEQPTTLNYFRLFSYPVIEDGSNKYTLCSGSRSGNPVKIYYRNDEYAVPDLTEKPFFYNGFNSGIKIDNSYATIEHTFSSPDKYAEITGATRANPTVYTLGYVPFETGDKVIICDTNVNKDITFSFTPDNPIIVTSTSHGLSTGSRIQFVVTLDINGDPDYILPGYLYDDVDYFVKYIDANSFHITDVIGSEPITALDDESGSLVVPALIKSGSPWELNTETTISSKTNTTITLPINSSSYTEWLSDDSDKDGTSGVIKLASGIGSVSFMVYADTLSSSLNLLKIGSTQISLSTGGVISTGSTSTKYVNGVSGGTFKFGSWNNITITFADLIIVNGNQPVLLTIGDSSAVTQTFYLDQLSIFDKTLTSYFAKDLYCLYTGKNDVDLFTQTVDTGFKIYDLGPATAGEDEYTINENIVGVDYILSSTSTDSLYPILSAQTGSTYDLSLSYQQVDGEEVLIKNTVKKTATSGSSSILYLADSANLSVGAKIVKIGDTNVASSNPTITAIDDMPVTKKITSSIAATSLGTHIFTNLSNVSGISIGDKVSSSAIYKTKVKGKIIEQYVIAEGTQVQKINGSNITIQFPNDKKGFKVEIPSGTKITFTPTSAKVTVTSLPNVATLGTAIAFENIKKSQNVAENNKLIVDGEYLKSGDKLLFKDVSPPIMYQVSSASVDQQIYNTTKTVIVSFEKIALIDGYVYSNDEDLTINPGEDENKLIKYISGNIPPFSSYSDFRDKKVSSSQPPQYAIQE